MSGHSMRLHDLSFRSKKEATEYFKGVLNNTPLGEPIRDFDTHMRLLSLLSRHPRSERKVGCGVNMFIVSKAPYGGFGSRCFHVVREDGSSTDFSYMTCIKGKVKTLHQEYLDAARHAIEPYVFAFRDKALANKPKCPHTGIELTQRNSHADHKPPWLFKNIASAFLDENKMTPSYDWISEPSDNQSRATLLGDANENFCVFHNDRADLELIHWKKNISFGSSMVRK